LFANEGDRTSGELHLKRNRFFIALEQLRMWEIAEEHGKKIRFPSSDLTISVSMAWAAQDLLSSCVFLASTYRHVADFPFPGSVAGASRRNQAALCAE
jgi:hypothetical protein